MRQSFGLVQNRCVEGGGTRRELGARRKPSDSSQTQGLETSAANKTRQVIKTVLQQYESWMVGRGLEDAQKRLTPHSEEVAEDCARRVRRRDQTRRLDLNYLGLRSPVCEQQSPAEEGVARPVQAV